MIDALFPIRSALFIDYDNIRSLASPFSRNVANWLAWLQDGKFDGKGRRKFVRKIAYWHPVNATQEQAFRAQGFDAKTCIYTAGSKRDQSAVDLHLAVDVVTLACSPNRPKEIIILATDSDYFPIIKLLNDKKVRSVIVVSERDASYKYEGVADAVITAEDLVQACAYERPRAFFALRAPAPKPAKAFDIAQAADAVAKAAIALAAPMSVRSLLKLLRDMPGFTKTGPGAYFGLGSLNKLTQDMVRRRPELKMWRGPRGLMLEARPRAAIGRN